MICRYLHNLSFKTHFEMWRWMPALTLRQTDTSRVVPVEWTVLVGRGGVSEVLNREIAEIQMDRCERSYLLVI